MVAMIEQLTIVSIILLAPRKIYSFLLGISPHQAPKLISLSSQQGVALSLY